MGLSCPSIDADVLPQDDVCWHFEHQITSKWERCLLCWPIPGTGNLRLLVSQFPFFRCTVFVFPTKSGKGYTGSYILQLQIQTHLITTFQVSWLIASQTWATLTGKHHNTTPAALLAHA